MTKRTFSRTFLMFNLLVLILVLDLSFVSCTWRYYNQILYGSGDTYMTTYHNHGGSNAPYRKWIIECQDGEAMVAVQDWLNDYDRLEAVMCKFMFPNKPPALRYPYYSSCHVRDYGILNQMFCFDPMNASLTMHTFITGLWDNDQQFIVIGRSGLDNVSLYKCCKVPTGYYIDYVSCYYMPTHDLYFEYYDATQQQILVSCGAGYAMTGIARKQFAYTGYYKIDWIQCCRVGFGPPTVVSPPVVYSSSGTPSYYAREAVDPPMVSRLYQEQYRTRGIGRTDCESLGKTVRDNTSQPQDNYCSSRYQRQNLRHDFRREHDDLDQEEEEQQPDHNSWTSPNTKNFLGFEDSVTKSND